jgi:hypothetical protein
VPLATIWFTVSYDGFVNSVKTFRRPALPIVKAIQPNWRLIGTQSALAPDATSLG